MADHRFRSRNYVNLIVIDKQPQQQWLSMAEATEHCARGADLVVGRQRRRQQRPGHRAGLVPGMWVTMEIIAAAEILLTRLPNPGRGWSTWST